MKKTICFVLVLLGCTASMFAQGSLTPPGPPAPTMRTLDQLGVGADQANTKLDQLGAKAEKRTPIDAAHTHGDAANMFIIKASGSYYLTGNVTGDGTKHGISVRADDVTIDLNGFSLESPGGLARGIDAAPSPAPFLNNLCVRNGSIRGWGGDGVHGQAAAMLAENLRVSDNTTGVAVGNGSMIKDCVATGNRTGFDAADRTHIINCIATLNASGASFGDGFSCTSYVTLIDCTASRNNGRGIAVENYSSVVRCNAGHNNGTGIITDTGCTVEDSTAGGNGEHGFDLNTGNTLRHCTTSGNIGSGVLCASRNFIIGNACNGNGEGMSVVKDGNRIEGNSSTGNADVGYDCTGATHTLLIGNSAYGNGGTPPFVINTATNAVGPIVDMSGGGTIASTSPFANIAY